MSVALRNIPMHPGAPELASGVNAVGADCCAPATPTKQRLIVTAMWKVRMLELPFVRLFGSGPHFGEFRAHRTVAQQRKGAEKQETGLFCGKRRRNLTEFLEIVISSTNYYTLVESSATECGEIPFAGRSVSIISRGCQCRDTLAYF